MVLLIRNVEVSETVVSSYLVVVVEGRAKFVSIKLLKRRFSSFVGFFLLDEFEIFSKRFDCDGLEKVRKQNEKKKRRS